MMDPEDIPILPYSYLVGQDQLQLALAVAYIAPAIGGVLISGHRGTGKSTAVRAFSKMMYDDLPVTLPINATEDRVVGGWHIDRLFDVERIRQAGGLEWAQQDGLLTLANGKLLFVDEINLLDDHIVNIILDATATGILVIQREEQSKLESVSFTLVGTMNPEEGGLRPQLLDRFGLVVSVQGEADNARRTEILQRVMEFDRAKRLLANGRASDFYANGIALDSALKHKLQEAKGRLDEIVLTPEMAAACVQIATAFHVEGHRADYVIALAARALAAWENAGGIKKEYLQRVAPMALMHRRPEVRQRGREMWSSVDDHTLAELLSDV